MTFKQKIRKAYIRWSHWEYWPTDITYSLIYFYIFFLGIRLRNFYFFTAANPGIEYGGVFGEKKSDLVEFVPTVYRPKDRFVKHDAHSSDTEKILNQGFTFPIVVKPNQGEGGRCVQVIDTIDDWKKFHSETEIDYLIQECLPLENEYGVMVYTSPITMESHIGGITRKAFLTVIGDGASSVKELILDHPRAIQYWDFLAVKWRDRLHEILPKRESLILNKIGNHRLGTQFLCGNHLIGSQLTQTFSEIVKKLPGMYCIRFDLKCPTDHDLINGKNIKIMEINGSSAEPTHMYDPKYSFWQGQKILFSHWKTLFQISKEAIAKGAPLMSYREWKEWRKMVKTYQAKIN